MGESTLYYVGAAFIGGVILNIMPCVLPVLTMKVFHVIENAKAGAAVNRKHGIAYTMGIMTMFWVLAAVIIGLRAGGEKMGWGMQFQNPVFLAIVCGLMVALGLNALGVFEITIGMSGGDGDQASYKTSYFNGIVAAVMSTPCSAPFLGAAASFALGAGATTAQTLLMFTFIGFGLSFPFLVISFIPAIAKVLPRPGAWMETFKQVMGFTLLAAAIYFMNALQAQITRQGVTNYLFFLLLMSIGLWAIGRFAGLEHSEMRRRTVFGLSIGLTALGGYVMLDMTPKEKTVVAVAPDKAVSDETPVVVDGHINWAAFNPAVVSASLQRDRPVFMDYTAEWCVNCKTNEKVFIEVDRIRADLEKTRILPMKADFTNEDEVIEEWMEKLGREAIPIYVIYYPDGKWDLLPETITTDMLSKALHKASTKFPPNKFQVPETKPTDEKHATATQG
jgi:thiol:disulfide interchange protein